MKLRILALAIAAIAAVAPMQAQKADISPVPQKIEWGAKAFDSATATYRLNGKPDADAARLITASLPIDKKGDVRLTVGRSGDKAVKAVESRIPAEAEGYYLSIAPDGIIVAGRDDTGTFYGLQTLLQILSKPAVMCVEVTDAPTTALRGVIEGFYGNPWSFDDRVSQFEFYGKNKLNIYVYGPKDDPYHHSRWYEPYPEAEAARMASLVKHASDNKVKFVWAMHPSNSIVSDADRRAALDKFQQMYDLGVRAFAIFFDDISAKSVDAQVDYLNFLTDNFVRTHQGVEPLIVCPTQYNKLWSGGDYHHKMGSGLYPEIQIMWTGNSVVDMIQKEDCTWFSDQTGRKPFIWLNYPVNDYGQHNLLMGPVSGNGNDIYQYISAFCSNPMQYAEASKVGLFSLADFAWNPKSYSPFNAWVRSMNYLMPDHTSAFARFCMSNADVGPSVHMLRMEDETPEFLALTRRHPVLTAEAADAYARYFNASLAAADELLALEGQSAMVDEIKEFIQCYKIQAQRGILTADMARALTAADTTRFIDLYKAYAAATAQEQALVSRGFEGSIQSVHPHTATLYVEPMIKTSVDSLTKAFRAAGYSYPADLFPQQLLENGTYYITIDGCYLTNVDGRPAPEFIDHIDEINPGRQQWIITYDPTVDRYSIKNEWDKKFVSNRLDFGKKFDPNWHTFTITSAPDGSFAIQCGGLSEANYWSIDTESTRLQPDKQSPRSLKIYPANK